MLIERRQELRLVPRPKRIPYCKVEKIGNYGLFFARVDGFPRVAPGTNYLHAMMAWLALWEGRP